MYTALATFCSMFLFCFRYGLNGFISNSYLTSSRIHHPASGRYIDTSTTEPGIQFYTAKYMDATGKAGHPYKPFASFCLETQHYPDSVNHVCKTIYPLPYKQCLI